MRHVEISGELRQLAEQLHHPNQHTWTEEQWADFRTGMGTIMADVPEEQQRRWVAESGCMSPGGGEVSNG